MRVVHDGTHGTNVNGRIRVKDQVRLPGAGELERILVERRAAGARGVAVVGDAHKAHRRVKVREEDWGYMACSVRKGRVWINRVGTFGFSSPGYYWSRLAAAQGVTRIAQRGATRNALTAHACPNNFKTCSQYFTCCAAFAMC